MSEKSDPKADALEAEVTEAARRHLANHHGVSQLQGHEKDVAAMVEFVMPYARQAVLADTLADKWMETGNESASHYRRALFLEDALSSLDVSGEADWIAPEERKKIAKALDMARSGDTDRQNFVDFVRDRNQRIIWSWCLREFTGIPGVDPTDPLQRAGRFLEEAIELFQAVAERSLPDSEARGATIREAENYAHRQVAYVFNRPPGRVEQEIGGVMVTLNALAEMLGLSIAKEERTETMRVLAMPKGHFRKRQEEKRDAGF